jgi:hypothetical protein
MDQRVLLPDVRKDDLRGASGTPIPMSVRQVCTPPTAKEMLMFLGYRKISYGLHAIGAKFHSKRQSELLRDGAPTRSVPKGLHVPEVT